jgi:hypothetical protein
LLKDLQTKARRERGGVDAIEAAWDTLVPEGTCKRAFTHVRELVKVIEAFNIPIRNNTEQKVTFVVTKATFCKTSVLKAVNERFQSERGLFW